MITLALNQGWQADFAMPSADCVRTTGLRALPEFMGEVSVHVDATRVRIATTDVYGFAPGNPTWRQPT